MDAITDKRVICQKNPGSLLLKCRLLSGGESPEGDYISQIPLQLDETM